jgi:hypothetical protein
VLVVVTLVLVASGRCRGADVSLPSALPTFGVGTDTRQSRTIGAAPGEVVANVGYALRLGRSQFDDSGRVLGLGFDEEFISQTFPASVTLGVRRTLAVGLSTTLANLREENFSLTNFQPGATLSGFALPLFSTTTYRLSGSGFGDTQINLQKALSGERRRTQKIATLDVTMPTGRADSRGWSDLPPGKGNADVTASIFVSRERYPWRGLVRFGHELNLPGTIRTADGSTRTIRSGNGPNLNLGVQYSHSPFLQFKSSLTGFSRDARSENGQSLPRSAWRLVEFRPGLDVKLGGATLSLEGLFPLAGRNTIRTQGFFQYVEFRFD